MVQHQFNNFTHWELDNPPNSDNQTQKSLHWLSLSQVVSVRFRAIGVVVLCSYLWICFKTEAASFMYGV